MYTLVYEQEALVEYQDSVTWYLKSSNSVAEQFVNEVETKIDEIKANPLQFPRKFEFYFETHLKKFPFTIVYLIEESTIVIMAIYDQKRKPTDKYR